MLLPDMDSRAVWREVTLLRNCAHRRIVPLYGVAIKVPIVDCCLLSLPCLPVQLWVAMWLIVAECLLCAVVAAPALVSSKPLCAHSHGPVIGWMPARLPACAG